MNVLLIAFALGLLVIVSGMKLLAQTQKDALGNLYKYVSWFVTIMGFFILFCVGVHCIMNCCHRGERRMMMHGCRMDNECNEMRGCNGMMNCERGMMRGNDECSMHNGCNMGGNCNMGGSCKEGSECRGMGEGDEKCPMMNGHCEEKDSVIVKKESKK